MSITNISGSAPTRLDFTRTVTSLTASVRQDGGPTDTSGSLDGTELAAAAQAQRWDLAAGGYSAAYRIKIGDWIGTGYMPAGASKEQLEKFVDEVMDYARRMRGTVDRPTEDDEVEFRFADPSSVKVEQKVIQLSAQSFTSELAAPRESGATSLLANLLTEFLDKLRGNKTDQAASPNEARPSPITDLLKGLDIRT
jgi:hypothetical protein